MKERSGNEFVVSGDHKPVSRPPDSNLFSLLKIPTVTKKPLHKRLRNRAYTVSTDHQRTFRLRKYQGGRQAKVRTGKWYEYFNDFDRAVHLAIGRSRHADRDGRRAEMVDLFEGKVKYHQIYDWRRGKTKLPLWAFEMLFGKLIDRHEEIEAALQTMKKMGHDIPEYRLPDIDL